MKRLLLLTALLPWVVQAQTSPIQMSYSWGAPTDYSDGKALPATDIWFYTLEWRGATSEGWMPYDSVQLDPSVLSYNVPMYCGVYTVTLTVTTTLTATEPFTTSMPESLTYDTGKQCPPDFEWIW